MIERLIHWSLHNRFLVLFAAAALAAGGSWALHRTPVDAIPDLSDVQVIVKTVWPGQAPQVIEDQVTYPLTTAMLAVPGAVTVRGFSNFGDSYVYVIFEDGTDLYWARSRVLEYLSQVAPRLPAGARPALGPDATGVGWVYSYALTDRSGGHDLAQLRSLQDWFLKYELQAIEGVAEVATVGGFVKQYQVVVDPDRLSAYGLTLAGVRDAIRAGNREDSGSVIELAEAEYVVRTTGYVRGLDELRAIPLGVSERGTPILLNDVAEIRVGPDQRRGIAELDGEGEVVGAIVVMRFGENARETIVAVKNRLRELRNSLPAGVEIVETYDRSALIDRAVATLTDRLVEEFVIVALVCAVFLFHLRSSLVIVISLPLGILAAFAIMHAQGISANIMSLGGIAIAIGAMVDAAIVMIENLHKHLERAEPGADRLALAFEAAREVGPALFFSLVIITVSFLPVFALEAQEGRLFKPLAWTKTWAMAAAAGLAVTLVPVLMDLLVRGRVVPEHRNPVNRLLIATYRPFIELALNFPRSVIAAALAVTLIGLWPASRLGAEFMPELDEGDLMYMPTTLPALSIGKAQQLLQQTDRMIRTVPEVEHVFGKIGRADTATDPAPLSMVETVVKLKDRGEWRPGMTPERLREELQRVSLPGLANAWVMPIRTRIDMLATGIKTPVGIKIAGPDLAVIQKIGRDVERAIRDVPGTVSAFAERVAGGRYITVDIDRLEAARLGLNIDDVQETVNMAVGGSNVTWTVEGLERYPVNLRYPRGARDSVEQLRMLPVITPAGARVPLGQLADIRIENGPDMIRSENARPNGWIYVDTAGRDLGGYVAEAKAKVAAEVSLPPGYSLHWSGQFEYLERATARLKVIVPFTLGLIVLLLYLNFRNFAEAAIILATLPFALV
ncbi:MAG TPA: CusA/CzcA family heavy metal efflux RND transporter, partial [Gammaproteobacteria bacterium]